MILLVKGEPLGGNGLTLIAGASRNHFDWGGVFIESPEYAIFIKLPEFYWMH